MRAAFLAMPTGPWAVLGGVGCLGVWSRVVWVGRWLRVVAGWLVWRVAVGCGAGCVLWRRWRCWSVVWFRLWCGFGLSGRFAAWFGWLGVGGVVVSISVVFVGWRGCGGVVRLGRVAGGLVVGEGAGGGGCWGVGWLCGLAVVRRLGVFVVWVWGWPTGWAPVGQPQGGVRRCCAGDEKTARCCSHRLSSAPNATRKRSGAGALDGFTGLAAAAAFDGEHAYPVGADDVLADAPGGA